MLVSPIGPFSSEYSLKSVLLHGGGLDSAAVMLKLRSLSISFDILHFDYGQVACKEERLAILRQTTSEKMITLDLPLSHLNKNSQLFTGNRDHNPIVEGRNILFIMEAARLGYSEIYVGLDKPASGVAWPDASKAFLDCTNNILSMSFLQNKVTVTAPFIYEDKQGVFDWALSVNPKFFETAFTCWTPVNGQHCGLCKHCTHREIYMRKSNV